MKAIVWNGPEEMAVEEVPEPTLEPQTVIVRPEAVGICGSEVEGYLGKMGNRVPPLVMGHEFAGTVTEVGALYAFLDVRQVHDPARSHRAR